MPTYDLECLQCRLNFEGFSSILEKGSIKCPNCNGNTRTLITQHGFQYYERWDETLQTYLTGPAQRRAFMKRKGIEEVHKCEVNRLDKIMSKKKRPTVHEASLRARRKARIHIGDDYCF